MAEEQVGLSSVHANKSFSGDLRHNCAPQLYWRFLLPEQDQQSKRSVCTFTAACHLQQLKQRNMVPSDFTVVGKLPV